MTDDAASIRERVLRGIGANRANGYHFPGHFLDVQWPSVTPERATLLVADGPHVRDAAGAVDRTVLMLLADSAVSTAARLTLAAGVRLATVHLHVQLTDTPADGDIIADATPRGPGAGTAAASWLGAATLTVRGRPVCYATGEFMQLPPPPGVTLAPLPWQREGVAIVLPDDASLDPPERAVMDAASQALARATPASPFIEWFWGGTRDGAFDGAGTAQRSLTIGPHVANRVGHVQGGISVGVATAAACDATPSSMTLSNVSAWYVRPAQGGMLRARARVIHAGRTTAIVRTHVLGGDDAVAVEVCTQHVARAAA